MAPPPAKGTASSVTRNSILLVVLLLHGMYLSNNILQTVMPSTSLWEIGGQMVAVSTATTTTVNQTSPSYRRETGYIPLQDLVQTNNIASNNKNNNNDRFSCGENMTYVFDTIAPELSLSSMSHPPHSSSTSSSQHQIIPRILHMTAKHRCVISEFQDTIYQWQQRLEGYNYSIYFHDEAAMDRLLAKEWPEFPHLQLLQQGCVLGGASKADLWRYLVIWEYGGLYTDIDVIPGEWFHPYTTIPPDHNMDAWILPTSSPPSPLSTQHQQQEEGSSSRHVLPAQYFFAASPKHPLLYFAILQSLFHLLDVPNILDQDIRHVTGEGAMKSAFSTFMQGQVQYTGTTALQPGLYVGLGNRSVTIDGTLETTDKYVQHHHWSNETIDKAYQMMGQKHYSQKVSKMTLSKEEQILLNVTCLERLQFFAQQQQQARHRRTRHHQHHQHQQPTSSNSSTDQNSVLLDDDNDGTVIFTPIQAYYIPPEK